MDEGKSNDFVCSRAMCNSFCFGWATGTGSAGNATLPFPDLRSQRRRLAFSLHWCEIPQPAAVWEIAKVWLTPETGAFTQMWPVAGARQCGSQLINANVPSEINGSSPGLVDWMCHNNTVRFSCSPLKMSRNERNNGFLIHLSQVRHPYVTVNNCIHIVTLWQRE